MDGNGNIKQHFAIQNKKKEIWKRTCLNGNILYSVSDDYTNRGCNLVGIHKLLLNSTQRILNQLKNHKMQMCRYVTVAKAERINQECETNRTSKHRISDLYYIMQHTAIIQTFEKKGRRS